MPGNTTSQDPRLNMRRLSLRPATPDPTPPIVVETQEMVNVNQKLKELGIEQTIQLPQICVVGDQSTGKSSLIEALSMVKVPRDTGCCTRCPLEVNLTKADSDAQPWSCKVSLIRKYDFDQPATTKPTKARPLGPWTELAQAENILFAESNVKEDVRNLIQRAQSATLNPHLESASFTSRPLTKQYKIEFSPNAVRLDIIQHELPSLSFVDLPGIVTHQSEKYLVTLVDNLVSQYARSERSINLLTLSMTSDYDTSKALSIILNLKAESRTLAVMTKPDRYPTQNPLDGFLGMLSGTNGPSMKYGYHVVMMHPDDSLSHAAAKQKEFEYFSNSEQWSNLGPAFQAKLGTHKLSETLSILLQEATRRNLPTSLQLIEDRLEAVLDRLQALPAPPGLQQMSIALTMLINDFGDKMIKLFEGGGNADEFLLKPQWDRLAEDFRNKLLISRPRLQLSTKEESAQKKKAERLTAELIMLSDEDISPPPKTERKVTRPLITPAETYHSFQLEEIREINQRHATAGLGPQMFPGARQAMTRKSVDKFDVITDDFISLTNDLIREHVTKHSGDVFRTYEHMPLYTAAMKHIGTFVEESCRQQRVKSARMCEMEKKKPYTLDSTTSVKEAKRYYTTLLNSRREYRLKVEKAVYDASQVKKAKRIDFKKRADDLDDDGWDIEIELLANVRAYHQIAASRHADNICHSIYARTFPKFAFDMAQSLAIFLGPMRPEQHDQMVKWMSENPERELERNRLLGEQANLVEARALVHAALGGDPKRASVRAGKRKAVADRDMAMSDGGTDGANDPESPSKKPKFVDIGELQTSVEADMAES